MVPNETFVSLEIGHEKRAEINNPFETTFERQTYPVYYKFLSIEIQSAVPPTDCIFRLVFTTRESNTLQNITFHSMEYRNQFIFENRLYILYLDRAKEFIDKIPLDIVPLYWSFTNKRDIESLARLFYKVTKDNLKS